MQNSKKLISKILLIAFSVLIMAGVLSGCGSNDVDRLVIYNWADYIGYDVLDEFYDYYYDITGREIEVIYSTFDTNENMMTTITKGKEEVDLVCPSDYAIQKLIYGNVLQPIDFSIFEKYELSNYYNIYGMIMDKIDDVFGELPIEGTDETANMADYFVPYMWGTLGILYNADIVTEEDLATGWGLLWNDSKNPALKGKILVKDSIRDTFCAATLYLKQEGLLPSKYDGLDPSAETLMNDVSPEMIAAVENVLKKQRANLKGYEVDFGKDDMVSGAAYVDLAWSGDAIYAIEEGELEGVNLDYLIPENGTNLWFDGWVIPHNAPNVEAAHIFIDFMCQPYIATMNSMDVGYVNSVDPEILMNDEDSIAIMLDYEYDIDEYFIDPARYPERVDPSIINTYGVMKDFGATTEAINMWERVKSGGGDEEGLGDLAIPVYILIAIAAAFVLFVAIYFGYHAYKRRPVRISSSDAESSV